MGWARSSCLTEQASTYCSDTVISNSLLARRSVTVGVLIARRPISSDIDVAIALSLSLRTSR